MKLSIFFIGLAFSFSAIADENPSWITKEKLAVIEKIGIQPQRDLKTKGNYRYGYVAASELKLTGYSCPPFTLVEVSRNIILVRAKDSTPCHDESNRPFKTLKVGMDGSVTPL